MVTKIINLENLPDNDIEEVITRVKILPVTSSNKVLLCKTDGYYHFVGGHANPDEDLYECLVRELKEETGIILEGTDPVPFYMLRRYSGNYFGTNKKCILDIVYCYVDINEEDIDLSMQDLDDEEIVKGFSLELVDLEDCEEIIKSTNIVDKEVLTIEMLEALELYREQIKIKSY